jgi:hypothetical protein
VEGYLRMHGVEVNGDLFPTLHIPRGAAESGGVRSYVLDVEGFFSRELSIICDCSYSHRARPPLRARHTRPRTWVQEDGRQACVASFGKKG